MLDSLSIEYDDNEIEQKKETNRYFSTERFRPLMVEVDDEHWELGGQIHNQENSSKKVAGVHVGGKNKHSHSHNHHKEQQEYSLDFFSYTHIKKDIEYRGQDD